MADLAELTALHDWMRQHGVTECAVGDVRLVLAPIERPIALHTEPKLTPEQEAEQELRDLMWSSGSDAEALIAMQKKTDDRLAKRGPQ